MWENEYALDPIYIYIYMSYVRLNLYICGETKYHIYMGTTGCIYVYMHIYIYTYISRKLHI